MLITVMFPVDTIAGAKEGLLLWYNSVLPALFPFLIGSNILISLGFVKTFGRFLEPVMRPIFNVPGCGAFAWLMGITSGYPIGAKTVADLRLKNYVSKTEAQRLMSFVNNSGPLFVIGFLGVGVLKSPQAGYYILITNFMSAFITGIIFKFYGNKKKDIYQKRNVMIEENTPHMAIGKLFGDSVKNAIEVITQIGGFIVLFCVIIRAVDKTGILDLFYVFSAPVFNALGLNDLAALGYLSGTLEITNGISILGNNDSLTYLSKILLTGSLVSLGGVSILAQTLSFTSKTDISTGVYLLSKFIQTMIWIFITIFTYPLFEKFTVLSVFAEKSDVAFYGSIVNSVFYSTIFFFTVVLFLAAVSMVLRKFVHHER